MSKSCHNKDFELAKATQNIEALKDSVRMQKNKAGELEFARLLIVAEKDELKKYNNELYTEMEKMRGKVISLTKLTMDIKGILENIKAEPPSKNPIALVNDTLTTPFKFDTSGKGWSRNIEGKTIVFMKNVTDSAIAIPLYNILEKDRMMMTIYPGIRKRDSDGMLEYTVRTDYPNVSFDIQGYADPTELTSFTKIKDDKWIIGPYLGLGAGITSVTNMGNSQLLFGPNVSIGIGVMYKLIGF